MKDKYSYEEDSFFETLKIKKLDNMLIRYILLSGDFAILLIMSIYFLKDYILIIDKISEYSIYFYVWALISRIIDCVFGMLSVGFYQSKSKLFSIESIIRLICCLSTVILIFMMFASPLKTINPLNVLTAVTIINISHRIKLLEKEQKKYILSILIYGFTLLNILSCAKLIKQPLRTKIKVFNKIVVVFIVIKSLVYRKCYDNVNEISFNVKIYMLFILIGFAAMLMNNENSIINTSALFKKSKLY